MTPIDMYLHQILQKYAARDLPLYSPAITELKTRLRTWAHNCYVDVINSGSRAKGSAISLASDVDYLVSLKSTCNESSGGLKAIYLSLYNTLNRGYQNVRKQNVSVRISVNGLEIDVTPGRRQSGLNTNHSLYVSTLDTWKQTNVQKHINDISQSGRLHEIRLLKVWRELNRLEFPSIYLEYLLIGNVLLGKSKDANSLANNVWYTINEFARDAGNPLFARVMDPANTANILSDLLSVAEKRKIIATARVSAEKGDWKDVVW
jgi:hypothetical protein